MSRLTILLLLTAMGLVTIATYYELPFAAGGSGVLFAVALGYAFVVAKRDTKLLTYALQENEYESFGNARYATGEPAE